jgi:hypothetical protein
MIRRAFSWDVSVGWVAAASSSSSESSAAGAAVAAPTACDARIFLVCYLLKVHFHYLIYYFIFIFIYYFTHTSAPWGLAEWSGRPARP